MTRMRKKKVKEKETKNKKLLIRKYFNLNINEEII
jgi:hypothetical protein